MRDEYRLHFQRHRETIDHRLAEFRALPPEEFLWELCYCLLTPGSRALHAAQAVAELRRDGFLVRRFDPTPYLRDRRHYIRFHNRKGERLLAIAEQGEAIMEILCDRGTDASAKRDRLVAHVCGLGWKEASHLLRNIGFLDLAILDRHILKHLHRCNAIDTLPDAIGSRRRYLEIEDRFRQLADSFGLSLQQLDLLFWSLEEGSVRK